MTPEAIKNQGCLLRVLFVVMICAAVGLIGLLAYLYYVAGVIWLYAGFLCLVVLFFTVPTLCLRKTHELHIHHTNIGMILATLLGYQSIPVTILHGIANGIMIEGGARWGYDAIWEKRGSSDAVERMQSDQISNSL